MKENTIPYTKPIRLSFPYSFPKNVEEITKIFRLEGHEIYLIGGSVRDLLLGREPNDHDFTISADANEMVRICKKYGLDYDDQYSFLNYIIVNYGDDRFDLNKFKGDSLRHDLAARDFTINSLAYDVQSQEIIDYMGGIEDVRHGIIRCNNPERFKEKPETTLRALRFALELGFRIDDNTFTAMQEYVGEFENVRIPALIKGISKLLNGSRDYFLGNIPTRDRLNYSD